jgi:hypothetical protein
MAADQRSRLGNHRERRLGAGHADLERATLDDAAEDRCVVGGDGVGRAPNQSEQSNGEQD